MYFFIPHSIIYSFLALCFGRIIKIQLSLTPAIGINSGRNPTSSPDTRVERGISQSQGSFHMTKKNSCESGLSWSLPRLRGEIPCIALSSTLLTTVTQPFENLSAARQVGVMELWNCAVFSLLPLLQFNIFSTSKFYSLFFTCCYFIVDGYKSI